jgi:hypothetical protein
MPVGGVKGRERPEEPRSGEAPPNGGIVRDVSLVVEIDDEIMMDNLLVDGKRQKDHQEAPYSYLVVFHNAEDRRHFDAIESLKSCSRAGLGSGERSGEAPRTNVATPADVSPYSTGSLSKDSRKCKGIMWLRMDEEALSGVKRHGRCDGNNATSLQK